MGTYTTPKTGHRLRDIIDCYNRQWVEAHQAESASFPPLLTHTARNEAYDDVMHYARTFLDIQTSDHINVL